MKSVAASPSSPSKMDDTKNPDDWQVKNWADTVTEGEAIKKDPKKMKHVKKHLMKSHKAIVAVIGPVKSTDDLRKRAKMMEGSPEEEASESPADEAAEKAAGKD